jgi:hypothetical protein
MNEVPKSWAMQETYCQLIPSNDDSRPCYQMIPRIGAFEVSYKGVLIFSKLLTSVWPHVPSVAKHIANMINDSNGGMNDNALRNKYQTDGKA